MTIGQLFDRVCERHKESIAMITMLAQKLDNHVRIDEDLVIQFYLSCRSELNYIGAGFLIDDESHDNNVWKDATLALSCIRVELIEEFKQFDIFLPELKVAGFVEDFIQAGLARVQKNSVGEDKVILLEEPGYDLKIRFITTPKGEAPEEVRNAWIGIEVPARFISGAIPVRGLATGKPLFQNDAYMVPCEAALNALKAKSPKAAQWFFDNLGVSNSPLYFDVNCAQTINTN